MHRAFLVVLTAAGTFVWFTSRVLPPVVASHFGADGAANGSMGKGSYTAFMLAVAVAVPALVGFSGLLVRVLPPHLINLPHRQHGLAPQRRAATLESLSSMSFAFASTLAAFLCFVHWLVVQANAVQPPKLSEAPLFVAMGVLGVATVAWLVALFRRFARIR